MKEELCTLFRKNIPTQNQNLNLNLAVESSIGEQFQLTVTRLSFCLVLLYMSIIIASLLILSGCGPSSYKAAALNKTQTTSQDSVPVPVPDTRPPTATLTAPLDGDTVRGVVKIAATVTDNIAVSGVTFRWDSVNLAPANNLAPYAYSWDTTKFTDGYYTLTALAVDSSGNQTISNVVTVRVLNTIPVPTPPTPQPIPGGGAFRRVPQDYATIQAAVNAAASGDTVLVSPGTYPGGISVSGKSITIASLFHTTKQESYISQTILSGGNPMLDITTSATGSRVIGLSFKSGSYAIKLNGTGEVWNCIFTKIGADSVSFEGSGGVVSGNTFISPSDDAIDADGPLTALIENNTIIGAGDDGIEIRNFNDGGPLQTITVRGNRFEGCKEDGIQIIDYSGTASRRFLIERNLIVNSAYAGIGIMDNGETVEDFRAASMPERVHIINNTLSGNRYGVSGGDNVAMANNIIANSSVLGLKGVDGNSIILGTLFYNNGTNALSSNLDMATTFIGDPKFNSDFTLNAGSPAIDKGTASFKFNGESILSMTPSQYRGSAPDVGAYEN